MGSSSPTPGAVRIGDRERDQATECLREHMAAGRLDATEFDQRIEAALTARYAEELQPLFVDLPAPRPDLPTVRREPTAGPTAQKLVAEPKPTAQQPSAYRGLRAATAIMWAVVIIACVASHWQLWWLLFIPVLMGGGCGGQRHHELRQQRRMAARQIRWDDHRQRFDARMRRLDHRHW
ncbi:DUF1707 domain-containing protein [Microlunatus sp. Gsoil 973]|uniref:DUF1707 SHOCT-like domain-containing protein n=1 Tax=Microlunatus sp. Gsoil 973 TaxID=2672569 RepID=UPI0012B4FF72|nr:DUF1707 domain-containing protein [Microlunatus sp. Gsoil 973]QGN34048.1 DUF1707 domain-containing protein [Microlunatus sp. Gsoil 973]